MSEHEDFGDPMDDDAFDALVAKLPDTLSDPAVWAEPPPWLGESVVATIAAEREAHPLQPIGAPPAPRRSARSSASRRWQTWTLAAAAVVAIAFAGVFLATRGNGDEGFALEPTDIYPEASAEAVAKETGSGLDIVLDVQGLPPAAPGQFYQAWMRSEAGDLVGIGTFHLREGDETIRLWSGVDVANYPIMTVTLQTEGQGTDSSGEVVLRGAITVE